MARQVLGRSNRPEMRALAEAIIDAQQIKIGEMQQWRQEWYGE
ncbi:MAG: DUF305 domain-containing protein [Elainellaceae cyanobacterium]